ncbi:helix-turn-helix transcriptional regulator [Methylopila sp. M107]|uniref:helix-turn-helix domain-containing protein n=1 Tax=Methylopila sp. M107 TaxID=1101190 RepID=UPI00068401F6|nr:helix-turn-helix transcriptional regulator [Methylopila sp. M107]
MIADAVREELARRRMSRQGLADLAKISISTLEKALAGSRPFTLATTVRLEEALGRRLRGIAPDTTARSPAAAGFAPPELGSYSRPGMSWIEGAYLTLRPSFGDPEAIYAYRTDISWSDENARMIFRESERLDAAFTQFGEVSAPHQSGHIYLVTNRHGQHRLVVLSRPTIEGAMYGVLLTLQSGRGSQLAPVATPIAMAPLKRGETAPAGRITRRDAGFERCRRELDRVKGDGFAVLL